MTCPQCGAALTKDHVCSALFAATMPMPSMRSMPAAHHDALTEPAAEVAQQDAKTRLAMDPTLPDVVEGYRVGYVVGSGGMATVYQAEKKGERVALKVARRGHCDEQTIARALREAKASARVRHPNVLDVKSAGLLPDGRPYLITALLDGAPLDTLLGDQGRLPCAAAVAVLDDVAAALEATHAVGVVHRDLKPGNVFIASFPDGVRAVLIDFGLALLGEPGAATPQTDTKLVPGTAEYTSPEQARGEALDAASDLYTLGVCAFELLAGELPFVADTATGVLRLHAREAAPPLQTKVEVPSSLAQLIDAMLAKEPADRPPSAAQVRAQLAQVPVSGDGLEGLLAQHFRSWRERVPSARTPLWKRLLAPFR